MENIETGVRCLKRFFHPITQAARKGAADYLRARTEAENKKRKETVLRTLSNLLKPK